MPSFLLNLYSLSALLLVGVVTFAVALKFLSSPAESSNPWVKGRLLNGLWWSTAGFLVLWGRASKWSLQPSLNEFLVSALVWTVCAVSVTEVMCLVGRRVRLLEHPLSKQMVLGSFGHAGGTIALLGLLFAASQFEPFTITCPPEGIDLVEVRSVCLLDAGASNCLLLTQCYGYNAQSSDTGLFLIVALLLTAWIPTASSIAHLFRTQRLQAEASNARSALAEAHLQSVRHQVNSHLVFNALNSILAAVEDQSPKAGEMIIDLSQLLRNSLDAEPSAHSLGKEGERLCLYLRIEKSRFEDDLNITYRVAEPLKSLRCLPMTVQPLVENAIKHGFRSGVVPLNVLIHAELCGDMIRVSVLNGGTLTGPNSKTGASGGTEGVGTGIGLELLRQRLIAEYGNNWKLELTEEQIDGMSQVRAIVEWPAEELMGAHA